MKKETGIYKITCKVNKKTYIGQSVNIDSRWLSHKQALNNNTHKNKHLQRAWNKYGDSSFTFEVLEICDTKDLSEREIYWIDKTKSFENGFNMTKGGEGNNKVTIICLTTGEVFSSVSEIECKYGIPNSNIIKCCKLERQSAGKLENGTPLIWNYYNYGEPKNKLTRKEIYEYMGLNKKIPSNARKVRCINTGEIFDMIADAERKYDAFGVRQCCNGKYKSSGFKDKVPLVWQWYDDFKNGKVKPIVEPYIICLNDLKEFYSIKDAMEFYNLDNTSLISQCVRKIHGIKKIRLKDEKVITFLYYKEYKEKTEEDIEKILNSL